MPFPLIRTSATHRRLRAHALAGGLLIATVALAPASARAQQRPEEGASPAGVQKATASWLCALEQAQLSADLPGHYAFMGESVALDGDTLVVGAPSQDGGQLSSGAVFVFERSGGTWSAPTKLIGSDTTSQGDDFGHAVDVQGDTLVVGAWHSGFQSRGRVYVFTRSGGPWTEVAKLEASDPFPAQSLGSCVALDGDTLVAGTWDADAAYVFRRSGSTWAEEAKLVAGDLPANNNLGRSVAIEGDRVYAGAPNAKGGGSTNPGGAVYVFLRSGTTWSEETKVVDPATVQLGRSVSVDGDTLVAGDTADGSGAAYVFKRSAGVWSLQDRLVPFDPQGGVYFAQHLDLDGDTLAVGVYPTTPIPGAMYLFARTGGSWTHQGKLVPNDGVNGDQFGVSVAVDGTTLVAGAPYKDLPAVGSNHGVAYVFEVPQAKAYCTAKPNSQGCTPEVTYCGFPSLSDPGPFDITASLVLNNKNGIFFYGWSGPATLPFKGGTLCVKTPVLRTPVQWSGGSPPPDDCSGTFTFDFNAYLQGGGNPALGAGSTVSGQFWYRDPASTFGTGLSDAIQFTIGA